MNITDQLRAILDVLLTPLLAAEQLAIALASRLSVVSLTLMDIFLVIIVVVTGIKFALSNSLESRDFFFNFLKLVVFWAVIYWIVGSYDTLVTRFYDGFDRLAVIIEQETSRAIVAATSDRGIEYTADLTADGQPDRIPGTATVYGFGHFLAAMEETSQAAYEQIDVNVEAESNWRPGSGIGPAIKGMALKAQIGLIKYITAAVMVVYLVIYAVVVTVLWFLKAVVIAIGPLMLAFFLVPYLSYVADGWVRVAIMTGMIYVVLTMIMALFTGILLGLLAGGVFGIDSFEGMTNEQIGDSFSLFDILHVVLFTLIGAFMMLQAPRIVEILLLGRGAGLAVSTASAAVAQSGGNAAARGAGAGANAARAAGSGVRGLVGKGSR